MLTAEVYRQAAAQKRRDAAREKPSAKDTPCGARKEHA